MLWLCGLPLWACVFASRMFVAYALRFSIYSLGLWTVAIAWATLGVAPLLGPQAASEFDGLNRAILLLCWIVASPAGVLAALGYCREIRISILEFSEESRPL